MLIRALEPTEGKEVMEANRILRAKTGKGDKSKRKASFKLKELCSGPSKLCQSLDITKENSNEKDLLDPASHLWVEEGVEVHDSRVRLSKRIGIDGAGPESRDKLYRFYEMGNHHVSVIDKVDR